MALSSLLSVLLALTALFVCAQTAIGFETKIPVTHHVLRSHPIGTHVSTLASATVHFQGLILDTAPSPTPSVFFLNLATESTMINAATSTPSQLQPSISSNEKGNPISTGKAAGSATTHSHHTAQPNTDADEDNGSKTIVVLFCVLSGVSAVILLGAAAWWWAMRRKSRAVEEQDDIMESEWQRNRDVRWPEAVTMHGSGSGAGAVMEERWWVGRTDKDARYGGESRL